MKELSFEKMENLNGGDMTYCQLLRYWYGGGSGYQGSQEMLNFGLGLCNFYGL